MVFYKKMDFNFQPLYDQPFDRDSLHQCFLNCTWDTTLKTGVIPIMKGKLIKKVVIAPTMGPGVAITL